MLCKKCGNEIKEEESFCSKCGKRIKPKGDKKSKKLLYIILGIIILVIIGIVGIALTTNKNTDTSSNTNTSQDTNNNDIQNQENSLNTEMPYYNFIDTQYETFNFTEEEYVKRIMKIIGGDSSYKSQGFERMKATVPNQYNYAKVINGAIHTMSIVSNPSNGKVSSVKLSVLGYDKSTEEQLEQNLYYITSNLVGGIVNYTDTNDTEKMQEGKAVMEEILDEVAIQKGLQTITNIDSVGRNGYEISTEIKVVKNTNNNTETSNNTSQTNGIRQNVKYKVKGSEELLQGQDTSANIYIEFTNNRFELAYLLSADSYYYMGTYVENGDNLTLNIDSINLGGEEMNLSKDEIGGEIQFKGKITNSGETIVITIENEELKFEL